MSKNQTEIPFTEMVERVSEILRLREDVEKKIRGVINDIYVRDISKKEDWSFLISTSSMTFVAAYGSGNATIQPGSATITFSSEVVITSAMIGRKIKLQNNAYLYNIVSMSGTTGAVIGPTLSGTESVTNQSYEILQPVYPLNLDFDRFPKNGGLHIFQGGLKKIVPEKAYGESISNFQSVSNDNTEGCRILGMDTAGRTLVEVSPPPKNAISAEYDYLRRILPLREETSGVIDTVSAAGTTVTGSAGTTRFTTARTGDFFRVDNFGTGNDSEWYRIIAIANDSSLTLSTAFGTSGATSAAYTICPAPQFPTMMHPAVLYGAIVQLAADQNDSYVMGYKQEYANILTDSKRLYKTRIYNPEIETIAEDFNFRR